MIEFLNSNWRWLVFLIIIGLVLCQKPSSNKNGVSTTTITNESGSKSGLGIGLGLGLGYHSAKSTEFEFFPDGPIIVFTGTGAGSPDLVQQIDPETGRVSDINASTGPTPGIGTGVSDLGLSSNKATYASLAVDLEKDGYVDLLVAREDGVYYYKNNRSFGLPFTSIKLMEKREGLSPFHLTMHDFDRDGNPDFFIRQRYDGSGEEGPAVILRYCRDPYEFTDVTDEFNTKAGKVIHLETSHQSDVLGSGAGNNFLKVKLPKTVDYAGAQVIVVVGRNYFVKYNQLSSEQDRLLTFDLGNYPIIDKVKIVTMYNKEKVYLEPQINTVLTVDPVVQFDQTLNHWRSTSSAS